MGFCDISVSLLAIMRNMHLVQQEGLHCIK